MLVNIVIGIRENFKIPAYVMLYSLLYNNKGNQFKIYILSDKLEKQYFDKLEKQFECQIEIIIIDIEDIKKLNPRHIDISTFYRLKINDYIPKTIDRLLYLDTDLIINGDISELLTINLGEENCVAAVKCGVSKKHLENIGFKNTPYFNAGVIVFDYQKCLKGKIFTDALKLIIEDEKDYIFMDQDVLNITLKGKVEFLDLKWNYGSFYAKSELLTLERQTLSEPIIIHYTGKYKAWDYDNINQYAYLYHKYYEMAFGHRFEYKKNIKGKINKRIILFCYNFFITKKIINFIRNNIRT